MAAALEDRAGRWFQQYDVVTPVVARGPGAVGTLDGRGHLATCLAWARSVPCTLAWNLAGFPAVTDARRRAGLPLSVQLVGRPGSEALLLAVATGVDACEAGTLQPNAMGAGPGFGGAVRLTAS